MKCLIVIINIAVNEIAQKNKNDKDNGLKRIARFPVFPEPINTYIA